MTSDAMELKPCPFCGHNQKPEIFENEDGLISMLCVGCFAEGPLIDHEDRAKAKERAIAAWNARTPSLAAQDGLVDALAVHLYERSMSKTLGAAKLVSWSDDTKAFWIERARAALASIEVKS